MAGYLGRLDEAFEWLERAFDEHDTYLFFLHGVTLDNNWWGMAEAMLADPRLEALWQRMGLDQFH